MDRADVEGGSVPMIGNPLKFSRTPVSYRHPPPRFGEHTDAVAARAGIDPQPPKTRSD